MFPGCFYLIGEAKAFGICRCLLPIVLEFVTDLIVLGMWYKRSEAQKRYSLFFSSTSLAGAFGGLLASAIGKLDNVQGYSGWRWIFILEGTLTCVVAILFFFIFPAL